MDLLEHVAENIARRQLLRRGSRVVVAVSGGVDSVVLLCALHQLAAAHHWQLQVAHFHHGLRGRASTGDQAFTKRLADQLSLPFFTEKADVRAWAHRHGLSVEMAARDLRHAFLAKVAAQTKAKKVALAHHADDQVELFFLRLLRGAGSDGLSGMKWMGPSPASAKISLIRPLLDIPKEELAEYARAQRWKFREDASNESNEFLRNRVRGELLPLLEKDYQPGLRQVVLRQMELLRAESEFIADSAREHGQSANPIPWDQWPVAVQRVHLQGEFWKHGVAPGFDFIEAFRQSEDHPFTLPGGRTFQRDARGRIEEGKRPELGFLPEELHLALKVGQKGGRFAGIQFEWAIQRAPKAGRPKSRPGVEWFDADQVGERVVLRHWRKGDRFQPIGMKQPVKLQDWFTNQKIPRESRRSLVVATTDKGEIWWVEGLRIGETFKVNPGTKRLLRWAWEAP